MLRGIGSLDIDLMLFNILSAFSSGVLPIYLRGVDVWCSISTVGYGVIPARTNQARIIPYLTRPRDKGECHTSQYLGGW